MNEKLEEIEKLAGALMPIKEICLIVELKFDEFKAEIEDEASPIYTAYWRGFLKTKAEVNQKTIDLAKAGSSPAQSIVMGLLKTKNLEHG